MENAAAPKRRVVPVGTEIVITEARVTLIDEQEIISNEPTGILAALLRASGVREAALVLRLPDGSEHLLTSHEDNGSELWGQMCNLDVEGQSTWVNGLAELPRVIHFFRLGNLTSFFDTLLNCHISLMVFRDYNPQWLESGDTLVSLNLRHEPGIIARGVLELIYDRTRLNLYRSLHREHYMGE